MISSAAKQQSRSGINEGMVMNRRLSFATKNDFLYACVVLAVFVLTVVGLFRELTEPEPIPDTTVSRSHQPRST